MKVDLLTVGKAENASPALGTGIDEGFWLYAFGVLACFSLSCVPNMSYFDNFSMPWQDSGIQCSVARSGLLQGQCATDVA